MANKLETTYLLDKNGNIRFSRGPSAPRNIFNMDETGCLYRRTNKSTLKVKNDDCAGGKRSKERITIAWCASVEGEKLKPLIIGKSANPRCFKKTKVDQLSVEHKSNKKAWMNSALFEC